MENLFPLLGLFSGDQFEYQINYQQVLDKTGLKIDIQHQPLTITISSQNSVTRYNQKNGWHTVNQNGDIIQQFDKKSSYIVNLLNKIYFANLSQLELIEIAKKKVQIKEKRVNLKQREWNCIAMTNNIESLAAMENGYLGLTHIAKQEADIELEELELNTAPLHFFGLA